MTNIPQQPLNMAIPKPSFNFRINKTGLQPVSRTCGTTLLGFSITEEKIRQF